MTIKLQCTDCREVHTSLEDAALHSVPEMCSEWENHSMIEATFRVYTAEMEAADQLTWNRYRRSHGVEIEGDNSCASYGHVFNVSTDPAVWHGHERTTHALIGDACCWCGASDDHSKLNTYVGYTWTVAGKALPAARPAAYLCRNCREAFDDTATRAHHEHYTCAYRPGLRGD